MYNQTYEYGIIMEISTYLWLFYEIFQCQVVTMHLFNSNTDDKIP
jgi:hypothetical protein